MVTELGYDMKLTVSDGSGMDLALSANAAIDLAAQTYALKQVKLDATADGMSAAVQSPSVTANLANGTLNTNNFTANVAGLTATGSLKARDITAEPSFSGALQVAEFSPAAVMEAVGMEAMETADPGVLQSARLSASEASAMSRP